MKAVIFDCFGVIIAEEPRLSGEIKDQQLLDFIALLRVKYKTAMLTNIANSGSLSRRFSNDELSKYFDVVVVSGDIGFAKPEAQAYAITAQRLGVPLNECVMIDDLESYCLGAQGVGMKTIQYQSFNQLKHDLSQFLTI